MARHLVACDGLFLGSSSAANLVACVRLVHAMGWRGSGKRVATILCDSGNRHYSKFWWVICKNSVVRASGLKRGLCRNDDYLREANIPIDTSIVDRMLTAK